MKPIIATFIAALFSLTAFAGINNLIPKPKSIVSNSEKTITVKSVDLDTPQLRDFYMTWTNESGLRRDKKGVSLNASIVKNIEGAPQDNDEAYTIDISDKGIKIEAVSEKGLRHAMQTLRQLTETAKKGVKLPIVKITDWPSFPWRGYLIDAGRSYISVDELKREIDDLARFKMNVFHFHFTENQAWRMESKIYPQLNDSTNMFRDPGQFYTQAEASELADYARERGILFLPEVDMPGHSHAFEQTFGVSMQTPEGKKIIKRLVDEVCEVFPDVPYLHIGTDEVQFTDSTFVPEMVEYVRSKGKKAITWHPGWKYRPGEIDAAQLWSYRGKAIPGIPAIDSKLHYINHFDIYGDLVALFRSNIYHHKEATKDIIGTEIALWTDRYVDNEKDIITENNLYPAMLAIADRSWRGGGEEYFDRLGTNLTESEPEDFAEFADFERRLLHHKATTLKDRPIAYVKQTPVKWRITDAFPNNGDLNAAFPPESEGMKSEYTYADSTYSTRTVNGAGIHLRHYWGDLIPAFYSNPQEYHTAYAFTRVYSPKDQTVGLQAETQNYSRSVADITPPEGKWDFRNSRFFINGEEIPAPVWTNRHEELDAEIPLGNENFTARPLIQVKLRKGWNDVMIKLPVGDFYPEETRLVKWMFTFVFTTPDGRDAAPGLIYSADPE